MSAIAQEDCHPHRLRHTFATKLVMKGMDTMLARQLTRHKSESSFARYSKRALELQAHQQLYALFGEEEPDAYNRCSSRFIFKRSKKIR